MEEQKNFICDDCEDTFNNEKAYKRHKKEGKGCGIKELKPEDINNPNRCIYCNKILSCKKSLNTHLKTCKFTLKVNRNNEERMRILEEELRICKDKMKSIEALVEKVKQLENTVKGLEKCKGNKTINNYGNTYNNTYNIRPYNNPNFDIEVNPYDFAKMGPLMGDNFTKLLYFNENAPENHSMIFHNGELYAKCEDKFKKLNRNEANALYDETGLLRDRFGEILTDKISKGKDKHCIPKSVKKILKEYYADGSTRDDRIHSMSNSIKKYSSIALKTIKEENQRISNEQKNEIKGDQSV